MHAALALLAAAALTGARVHTTARAPAVSPIAFDWAPRATGGLPEPAGTVAHLVWQSGALVDTRGNAWTQVGTVPQVATGPWYPAGFGAAAQAGAGPFSGSNNYARGTGADEFDFAPGEDFFVVVTWRSGVANAERMILSNMDATNGWAVEQSASGAGNIIVRSGGSTSTAATSNTVSANGPNVLCAGRAGTSILSKLNLGATVTTNSTGYAPCASGANCTATLGNYPALGSIAQDGAVYEVVIVKGTPSDALCTQIAQQVFGLQPQRGGPVTVTRAATEACPINGTLFTFPANTACISERGADDYGPGQNVLINSENPCAWTVRGAATCGAGSLAPDNVTTSKRLHVATTSNDIFQITTVANLSAALPSFWIKKVSASGTLVLANPSSGTNGSWTINFAALGPGWERITPTHPAVSIVSAFVGVAGNVAGFHFWTNQAGGLDFDFFGGQQEPGATAPGPYHATAAAPVSWPGTVVTAPNALTDGANWCASVTASPGGSRAWNASGVWGLFGMGANGAANSARSYFASGTLYLDTYNAAGQNRSATKGVTPSAGSHTITLRDSGGALALSIDGTDQGVSGAGAGDGILSALGTVTIGDVGGGTSPFNGSISRVLLARRPGACP